MAALDLGTASATIVHTVTGQLTIPTPLDLGTASVAITHGAFAALHIPEIEVASPQMQAQAAVLASVTKIVRKVDIYERDAITPWLLDVPLVDGDITVDGARDERRTFDLTFENIDNALQHYPAGFWYDKVIKPYRGVRLDADTTFLWPQGEFLIDKIVDDFFPNTVKVTGRDYTKRLLEDKFEFATQFAAGQAIEDVIKTIAVNGGISKFLVAQTGQVLDRDYLFDAKTTRWKAISDIATAFGYELFFNAEGYLVMRIWQDPAERQPVWTFKTGLDGNLATYTKSADSTRVKNAIVVTGQSSDPNTLPVSVAAENHDPHSPTSIENLGYRAVDFYDNPLITSAANGLVVANQILAVAGLESYEVALSSLVFPWLEAMDVVEFDDPNPAPGDPTRFLLTDFKVPMTLATMDGTAKRVTVIR